MKLHNSLKSGMAVLAVGAMTALGTTNAAAADSRLMEIMDRGEVRVGVLGGFKPWSFRGEDGSMRGIEIDLAQSVADALDVDLEPVVVTSSNRMRFLQQGRIDVIIGGMYDTAGRREEIGMITPAYWASGPTLMAREGAVDAWEDVEGKPVCSKQGVFYNDQLRKQFNAEIVAFGGNTEAKQALRDKKCIAWIYDDSVVATTLASGDWDGYEMAVPALYSNPWTAAVPLEYQDKAWGAFMSGMAYRWQESGRILELQEKWDVPRSDWLVEMHEKHKWDTSYLE